jgi:hypothetical protein
MRTHILMGAWVANPKIQACAKKALNGGVISAFFNFFLGRCTFFAIVFAIIGIIGWFKGRDLTSYALFVTAIQGLLVLHSWKQDVAEQKEIQNTTLVVNTPPAS